MALPTPFHRIICMVIYVGLAWFSVVAKPIELPAVAQPRYMSNLTHVVTSVGTGGVRKGETFDIDNLQSPTLAVDTPTCTDHVYDASSGCKVTDASPTAHTITCLAPHCSFNGKGEGTSPSCYTHSRPNANLNVLDSTLTNANAATLLPAGHDEYAPSPFPTAPAYPAQPALTDSIEINLPSSYGPAPSPEKTNLFTFTTSIPHDQNEPKTTLAPANAPAPVPGQQTVYVTITDDPATTTPLQAEPFSNKPLSTGHPESNKTAIILGSVFGSLTVLCISIVSADSLLRRRRQKRGQPEESHDNQEFQDSTSSVEDMSELLRQQQQTYGYYGTQRVASSILVPQQMKSFPISSGPIELPTPQDEAVDKKRRDGH